MKSRRFIAWRYALALAAVLDDVDRRQPGRLRFRLAHLARQPTAARQAAASAHGLGAAT